jgi:hypothetical protein
VTLAPELAPGARVAERFRVEALAGRGGMGEVYRALDEQTGARVAIKVTRQTVEDEARFLREAQLLETLRDPAIVGHLAHGRLEDGRPYLAMEWLEGESLSERLARAPLSIEATLRVVRAVARALGAAHRRAIVHRDVKPSNVFLVAGAEDGPNVRLIDFGIARHTALRGATVTKTDAAIGTPHYMAPEQVRGARSVGPAADVFSLGCLLYECLVGRSPFASDTLLAALAAVLLEEPEPPRKLAPAISPELERVVLRMLSKDPAQRPADGDAASAALDAAEGDTRTLGGAGAPPTLAGLSHREQRLVLVLVALPSEERRAIEATQRADEPDPTTLKLRGIVEQSEGRVELSAEGALVASFSDAGATRDRVARALRCARRLVGSDAGVRVGIVAGRTVGGRVPVAESVERAIAIARTAAGASAGIGVDDDVAAFAAEEVSLTRVPGLTGALIAGGTTEVRSTAGPRLFGRDRERAAIASSIVEALGEPIARAIVIEGDAGIGRSAVLEAALVRAAADAETVPRVLEVRLDAGDHDAPLSVVVRLVRAAARIEDGEPIALRREKLAAHVASLEPDAARAAALLRDLGDLARVPIDDTADVVRGDRFLRGDLERRAFHDWTVLALREPLLLAIDDAHHADPSSLELLAEAIALRAQAPLVLVATARTSPDEERSGVARVLARIEPEIHRLGALLPRAARSLVDALAPELDAESRAEMVLAGEGNPFFLRELCAARARGAALPTSILAAIEERILRAPEESRRVLRALSLLGEPSTSEAIAGLVPGLPVHEIAARLEELTRAELVEADTKRKGLHRPRSVLVADAAYAMIPDDDRRVAHRLAGLSLAQSGAEPSRVAAHLVKGGEPLLAAAAYRDASGRALEAHDLATARAHADRGLALADAAPVLRGELLLRRAESARWRGDYAGARDDAMAALASFESSRGTSNGLEAPSLEAVGLAIVASSALGRFDEDDDDTSPWAVAERLLFDAPRRDEASLEVVVLCRGAAAWLGRGDRARATRWLERARTMAGAEPAPIARAWLATLEASRALRDGDLATFLAETERAVSEYERAGDARNACNQRVRLANALVSVGELERAEAALAAAVEDAERMGLAVIAGYAVQNLGHVRARLGRDAEGRTLLADALARADRLSDASLRAGAQLYLALLELGHDASRALGHAVSARESAQVGAFFAIARAIEARALLALGRREDAAGASSEACAWLEAHGPIEEGEAAIHRARVDVLEGSGEGAEARAQAARAWASIERKAAALAPALRAGFLERAPDHVRLRELALSLTSARDPRA